jgi:hypothetical protein
VTETRFALFETSSKCNFAIRKEDPRALEFAIGTATAHFFTVMVRANLRASPFGKNTSNSTLSFPV